MPRCPRPTRLLAAAAIASVVGPALGVSTARADPAPSGNFEFQVPSDAVDAIAYAHFTVPDAYTMGVTENQTVPGFSWRIECNDGHTWNNITATLTAGAPSGYSNLDLPMIELINKDINEANNYCLMSTTSQPAGSLPLMIGFDSSLTTGTPSGWYGPPNLHKYGTILTGTMSAPPVAADTSYAVNADGTLAVDYEHGVVADSQFPGSREGWEAMLPSGQPRHGSLTLNRDGSINYAPTPGFTGDDSFQYLLHNDALGGTSNVATVTIHVS